jgi:plasmid maintenance system antidote protein VapI
MVRVPTNRIPTHPGEMLLEEFLNPMGITQRDFQITFMSLISVSMRLSMAVGVSRQARLCG